MAEASPAVDAMGAMHWKRLFRLPHRRRRADGQRFGIVSPGARADDRADLVAPRIGRPVRPTSLPPTSLPPAFVPPASGRTIPPIELRREDDPGCGNPAAARQRPVRRVKCPILRPGRASVFP